MKTTRRFVRHSPTHRQRGGVTLLLIMVLIVLAALVGVLAVRGATGDLQMAGSQRVARTGFYCAEAGLNVARALAAANPADWATILASGTGGTWYPSGGIVLDLDGDTNNDVTVVMRDNVDETGGTQDFTKDQDLTVILTATCNSTTLESNSATRTVSQLVTYAGNGGKDYRYQAGHSSTHSGNEN
ncbi:MAG: pilus assembly PilX N-terminal domain-containing protein [Polyangia bacterium]